MRLARDGGHQWRFRKLLAATHRPVGLEANLAIGNAPDLAAVVYPDDPQQVKLLAIVDHRDGKAGPAIDNVKWERRIELGEGHVHDNRLKRLRFLRRA